MAERTAIEWTDATWNPVRAVARATGKRGWHCEPVSAGCANCYAGAMNAWRGTGLAYKPGHRDGVDIILDERALLRPLSWRRPRRIFVCSMTDLFASFVPDAMIDRIFAVMALCPQHTFQVLTKRPERMRAYVSDPATPHRVAKKIDAIRVQQEIDAMGAEEVRPIADYPGYFVSDRGRVLSSSGSSRCLYCGGEVLGIATKAYCSQKCSQNACYVRRTGNALKGEKTLAALSPDTGEQGHCRVTLYKDGKPHRELVHRLVLAAFARPPQKGDQGCHRNGDPSVNALPNLRWADQNGNWTDSKRHGSARRYHKLTTPQVAEIRNAQESLSAESLAARFGISDTQIRNIRAGRQWAEESPICWPLPGVWLGTSCEDQAAADTRVPELLATPAVIRFVSAEPLLGPTDFRRWVLIDWQCSYCRHFFSGRHRSHCLACGREGGWTGSHAFNGRHQTERPGWPVDRGSGLDWIVVGGESGPNARLYRDDWGDAIRRDCAAAGVAFFRKQLGSRPVVADPTGWRAPSELLPDGSGYRLRLADKKGGDSTEWPERLRVRQMPEVCA